MSAIIKDAQKCRPARSSQAPASVISMYEAWDVSSMFAYKEGGGEIFDICVEGCFVIFPTIMPEFLEHAILLAGLQRKSPANTAIFLFI